MTTATDLVEGLVVLAGDLTGSASAPELRATGVTPGTYVTSYNAGDNEIQTSQVVIDAKGRVAFARNSVSDEGLDRAAVGVTGIMRADGTTITVVGGVLSADPGTSAEATTGITGFVQPDNTTIQVDEGTLSLILPIAAPGTDGVMRPDNDSIVVDNGVLSTEIDSLDQATSLALGLVRTDDSSVRASAGVLSLAIDPAGNSPAGAFGYVSPGSTIESAGGVLSLDIPTADVGVKGIFRPDNSSIAITSGVISSTLSSPGLTSDSNFGYFQVGASSLVTTDDEVIVSVDVGDDKVISTSLQTCLAGPPLGSFPRVQLEHRTHLVVEAGGVLNFVAPSLNGNPTVGGFGILSPDGDTVKVDVEGTLSVDLASDTDFGFILPDNETIQLNSNILSADIAESGTLGLYQLPANGSMTVSGGVISARTAGANIGVLRPDTTSTQINGSGVLSVPTSSAGNGLFSVNSSGGSILSIADGELSVEKPIASDIQLGGFSLGTNLSVDGDVLSQESPLATESTLGIVQLDGDSITLSGLNRITLNYDFFDDNMLKSSHSTSMLADSYVAGNPVMEIDADGLALELRPDFDWNGRHPSIIVCDFGEEPYASISDLGSFTSINLNLTGDATNGWATFASGGNHTCTILISNIPVGIDNIFIRHSPASGNWVAGGTVEGNILVSRTGGTTQLAVDVLIASNISGISFTSPNAATVFVASTNLN